MLSPYPREVASGSNGVLLDRSCRQTGSRRGSHQAGGAAPSLPAV